MPKGVDVEDPSFQIGAVPEFSYFMDEYVMHPLCNAGPSFPTGRSAGSLNVEASALMQLASTLSWVENALNLTNAYSGVINSEDDRFGYIVPFPPDYTAALQAHWTTDIVALNSSCSWQTPGTTGIFNATSTTNQYMMLPEANLYVKLSNDASGMSLLPLMSFM